MRYIFNIDDNTARLVEAYRIKRGYKATAVAMRELIATGLEVAAEMIGPIRSDAVLPDDDGDLDF